MTSLSMRLAAWRRVLPIAFWVDEVVEISVEEGDDDRASI